MRDVGSEKHIASDPGLEGMELLSYTRCCFQLPKYRYVSIFCLSVDTSIILATSPVLMAFLTAQSCSTQFPQVLSFTFDDDSLR